MRADRGGVPGYRLYFGREYGEHVWEALLDAGREYGAVPVGIRRRWRVSNGRVGAGRMVLRLFKKDRVWEKRPLKGRYDVVIIGAGVHGLSTAYYLAKLGVKNVAVIDKGYVGGGASARTTAIIRANYLTPQGVAFFRESLKLYEGLAADLDFNILFSQMGRLDLGHADSVDLRPSAEGRGQPFARR